MAINAEKHYIVLEEGHFYGSYVKAGTIAVMTEEQAKYEVLHGSMRKATQEEIDAAVALGIEFFRPIKLEAYAKATSSRRIAF